MTRSASKRANRNARTVAWLCVRSRLADIRASIEREGAIGSESARTFVLRDLNLPPSLANEIREMRDVNWPLVGEKLNAEAR